VTTVSERLVRVDAGSIRISGSSTLSSAAIATTFGAGALWLTEGSDAGDVTRVDPSSLASTTVATSVAYSDILAAHGSSIWVGNVDGVLERIDAGTGKQLASVQVGKGLSDVATDGNRVWAAVGSAT
jgi:hypothetical protein